MACVNDNYVERLIRFQWLFVEFSSIFKKKLKKYNFLAQKFFEIYLELTITKLIIEIFNIFPQAWIKINQKLKLKY